MNPDHQPSPWILVMKVISAIGLVLAALGAGAIGTCFAMVAQGNASNSSSWPALIIAVITLVMVGVLLTSAVLILVSKKRGPRE